MSHMFDNSFVKIMFNLISTVRTIYQKYVLRLLFF